ncbi:MAG TPA: hypothetical protein VGL65_08575 [Gemmatimonadales bacterium]|jgi:hypothetical protein
MSASQADAWVATTRPASRTQLQFHWKFYDEAGDGSRTAGRGALRMASPDSLRLDYRGPLGFGVGAAAVIGDSARWAQPEDQVQKLVPNYPLLWAMLGMARPPRTGWDVAGRIDPRSTAWRYTRGTDTVDYILATTGNTRVLEAYVREGGKAIGRVVTVFDAGGVPLRSRLDVLTSPARLEITFTKVTHPATFDSDTWHAPHD